MRNKTDIYDREYELYVQYACANFWPLVCVLHIQEDTDFRQTTDKQQQVAGLYKKWVLQIKWEANIKESLIQLYFIHQFTTGRLYLIKAAAGLMRTNCVEQERAREQVWNRQWAVVSEPDLHSKEVTRLAEQQTV